MGLWRSPFSHAIPYTNHPFPVIYWVVPYFWDTYDARSLGARRCWNGWLRENWMQGATDEFVEPELDSYWNLDHFRGFFSRSRPGPHEFHPKSPGLHVSLNGSDPLVFRLGKPSKTWKKWPEFQRRSFLWDFIDVVSSRQSTRMLLWQAAKNNEAIVHHLFLGLRFLHKQPLTLKHVACQGDNCLQNQQFSKNHYIASSSSDLAFGRGVEVHFFQKQVT